MKSETPYFRELYEMLQDHSLEFDWRDCPYGYSYLGSEAYEKVVYPWLPKARTAFSEMAKYRKLDTVGSVDNLDYDDQHQWYAFSRVNDLLLTDLFSMRPHCVLPVSKDDAGLYANYLATHYEDAKYVDYVERHSEVHLMTCRSAEEQYVQFFRNLGFSAYYDRPFHPFYHEIVEVLYDEELAPGEIVVGYVYWPESCSVI